MDLGLDYYVVFLWRIWFYFVIFYYVLDNLSEVIYKDNGLICLLMKGILIGLKLCINYVDNKVIVIVKLD